MIQTVASGGTMIVTIVMAGETDTVNVMMTKIAETTTEVFNTFIDFSSALEVYLAHARFYSTPALSCLKFILVLCSPAICLE